jgi:hypothetical protein
MTVISDRPFNALNELGWSDGGGSGEFDLRTDATAPHSPTGILHAWFPAGYAAGNGPVAFDRSSLGDKRTMYVAFWSRYSANYYGQSSGTNKQFYLHATTGDAPVFFFSAYGSGSGPLLPYIQLQGVISWSPNPGSGNLGPNLVPGAQIIRGQWNLVEVVAVGNTAGTADGSVDVYLNGTHVSSYTIQWQSGATTWSRLHGTTIWGGVGGTVPTLMSVDWDHIYLSAK